MVSHHLVYQLVLFALLWLCVILHLTRPKPAVVALAAPILPEPLKPKRHRPYEPKPFEGLTHKPHCPLCERETASPKVDLRGHPCKNLRFCSTRKLESEPTTGR